MNLLQDWKILALASAVFAGLTAVLAKIGVKGLPSNLATLIRTFVVVVFAGLLVTARGEWKSLDHLQNRTIIFLVLSGLATGFSWICYYRALQIGPASLVSSVDKSSLAVTVIIAVIFLGERLSLAGWFGVAFILLGTLLVAVK